MIDAEIFLDNDDYTEIGPLTALSLVTGLEVLMTGAVVKTKLCATDAVDAAPIDPSLDVLCTEEGALAIFRGKFEGSDLSAYLKPTYLDTEIFQHFYSNTDWHQVAGRTVRERRPA